MARWEEEVACYCTTKYMNLWLQRERERGGGIEQRRNLSGRKVLECKVERKKEGGEGGKKAWLTVSNPRRVETENTCVDIAGTVI